MLALGSLAFVSPWLLVALAGLPIIWWLLRVTPPAPRRVPFPAVRLLLGLVPREETPARTPWWLILLRTVLAALVILALAAKRSEALVEETIRVLLGRRDPLNAEAVAKLTEQGAPPLLSTVEVEPVSLAVFDELLCSEGAAA